MFPIVLPVLDREHIYKCRCICKRWTTAIDKYLENLPCYIPYNNDAPELVLQRKYSADTFMRFPIGLMFNGTLKRLEGISNISTLSNPFIGRSIVINPEITNFSWENDFGHHCAPKLERLCKILESFGKFVYHLEWIVLSPSVNSAKFYVILCRLLSYLPNLKTLRVRFWLKPLLNKEHLLESVENLKLPQIESLHSIDLNILDLPNIIEEKLILAFGTGVKKLCLPISPNLANVIHKGLTSLNELCLWSIYDLNLLQKLINKIKQIQLPVKKLKLELGKQFDVIEILNYLVDLNIGLVNFGKSDLVDDLFHENFKGNLNNSIHTLEIRDSFELGFKFLRHFSNLSYLVVRKHYVVGKWFTKWIEEEKILPSNNEIANFIRLCVYCDDSPGKKFWNMLPMLKYIIVESDVNNDVLYSPSYLAHPVKHYARQ